MLSGVCGGANKEEMDNEHELQDRSEWDGRQHRGEERKVDVQR